ncbi:hypothetical protein D3C73_1078150 [compost metagenome]
MKNMEKFSSVVFKFIFFVLPILFILSIIKFFKEKKYYNKEYMNIRNIVIILYSYGFIHIICHAILGSSIDRYAVPAYITTIVALFLDLYMVLYNKKYKSL